MQVTIPTTAQDLEALASALVRGQGDTTDLAVSRNADGSELIEIKSSAPGSVRIVLHAQDGANWVILRLGKHTRFQMLLEGDWGRDRKEIALLVDLIRSAVEGQFVEKVWRRQGKFVRSEGTVRTAEHGRRSVADLSGTLWIFPWFRPRTKPSETFEYSPYGIALNSINLD